MIVLCNLYLKKRGGLPENRAGSMACADEGFFWLFFLVTFLTKKKVTGLHGQERRDALIDMLTSPFYVLVKTFVPNWHKLLHLSSPKSYCVTAE